MQNHYFEREKQLDKNIHSVIKGKRIQLTFKAYPIISQKQLPQESVRATVSRQQYRNWLFSLPKGWGWNEGMIYGFPALPTKVLWACLFETLVLIWAEVGFLVK